MQACDWFIIERDALVAAYLSLLEVISMVIGMSN